MARKIVLFAAPGRVAEPSVRRLKEAGWVIGISYRKGKSSETTARQLAKIGAYAIKADVSKPEEAERAIKESFGIPLGENIERIALVNVASHYPPNEAFKRWKESDLRDEDWKYFNSNFGVMQNTTSALLNNYAGQPGQGPEIDIISFADGRSRRYFNDKLVHPFHCIGKETIDLTLEDAKTQGLELLTQLGIQGRDFNPYMLSKLLIMYATRELALQYPGGKVRINAIAPGILGASPNDSPEAAERFAEQSTILQEVGGFDAAANEIVHLLEGHRYQTGEIINLDGGQYLKYLHEQETF